MAIATVDLKSAPRVSLAEAKDKLEKGQDVVFVDLRSPAQYEQAHIPGAISIPLEQLARRIAELPRDKEIIFY